MTEKWAEYLRILFLLPETEGYPTGCIWAVTHPGWYFFLYTGVCPLARADK